MYAGSRWVQDHDVRASVALYEGVGKYILHIPGEEFAVVYAVRRCVYARVCDCVLYVFYAYDLRGRGADILGYGAGAGVEVIYDFLAAELREVPGQRVEAAGLGSVGLEEGLGADFETQLLHLLPDRVGTVVEQTFLIGYGVVHLSVYNVI